jgi:hypothetical protein
LPVAVAWHGEMRRDKPVKACHAEERQGRNVV